MINYAYLAGFIDGEGTIGIRYHRDKRLHKGFTIDAQVYITNSNRAILEIIQKEIGGSISISTAEGKNKNSKPVYRLKFLNHKIILSVLTSIVPYIITKKEQTDLLIKFCNLREKRSYGNGYSQEELRIANRIINLNKRGLQQRNNYYEMMNKIEKEMTNQKRI